MKRICSLLLTLALVLGLCACGQKAETAPTWQEQYDLGIRYLSEGNYQEAILAFTAAIEIDPKRAEAYAGLADVYTSQGDTASARKVLEDGFAATGDSALRERLDALDVRDSAESGDQEPASAVLGEVTGTLNLSNVTCVYDTNSRSVDYNEDAVGGLEFSFTVNGPGTVRDVWISGWNTPAEDGRYTQDAIEKEISMMTEIWREEASSIGLPPRKPPFEVTGTSRPVDAEDLGQTQEVLLIGLDENMNAAGYAVITVTIPG